MSNVKRKFPHRAEQGSVQNEKSLSIIEAELKELKEALQLSTEFLRATFDQAAVGITITDFDGRFLDINQRGQDLLGYSLEELQSLTVLDVTHPSDVSTTKERLQELLAGKIKEYSFEKRYIRKDSGIVWSHTTVTLVRDANGIPNKLVGIMQEITDKKIAEEAFRKSEFFNRAIIESSRDCIKVLDLNGGITWISEAGRKALQIEDPEHVRGKLWAEFWEGDQSIEAQEVIAAVARGETKHYLGHFPLDEQPTWWDVVLTPIFNVEGLPESILAISRDVTNHIRNEKLLHEKIVEREKTDKILAEMQRELLIQQVRLHSIIQYSEDAIVTKNLQGIIQSWNPSAERIFGYTSEEAVGKSILLIIPKELEQEEEVILSKISKGERVEHFETTRVAKDGRRLFISVTSSPIKDPQGKIIGATKIARDVTERRRSQAALEESEARYRALADERSKLLALESSARKQIEEANRTKDHFLATLSHELRTPLNAILGWAQLTARRIDDPAKVKEGLDIIARNARSQSQIIEDLLDMNRIMSGTLKLETQNIRVESVVDEAIDTVLPSAQARNITIRRMYTTSETTVLADPSRFKQIIWNLLTNAVKFSLDNGIVTVEIHLSGKNVEILVKDSGIGIKDDFLPYIFDRFSQSDTSSSRRFGGLGLGLSIVRHLVELHGGRITASSDGLGKGASFVVAIPVVQRISPHQKSEKRTYEQNYPSDFFAGISALIVDDEVDALTMVGLILKDGGAETFSATNVKEALEMISCHPINLIISDIGMPDENGYDLIHKVRNMTDPKIRRIPAIALTAYARSDDRIRALEAGFQMHIPKPVETSELVAVLNNLKEHCLRN